jgi:hypothetical protein
VIDQSGSGCVPAFRGIAQESGAQPLSSAYSEQPRLGDAFGSYTGNPSGLPVDTHEMVAMVAPRGLFIMENPHVDWLAARSGSVAALGAGDNITYWSDAQDGTHCATRSEWQAPLRANIQKFLLRSGGSTGGFRIAGGKAGDLSQRRDWQTPPLSDGPGAPLATPPTTPPTTPLTTPPPSGAGCSATVSTNQWTGGFAATVRVTAGSSPVNGGTVAMTLPSGASITNAWNTDRSGNSGAVQFGNVAFNGSNAPGQSTEFGFQGTGTGTGMAPACSAG